MKHIFRTIVSLGAAALLFACSPEQIEKLDETKLPQASELDVNVTVDQSSNYVTFTMNNSGVMPIWIFDATDPIDDASGAKVTGKKYAYSTNDLKLRFRDAGTHSVEVKAMNRNGISQGSKTIEFTLNETYRDPFDPSPYIKAITNGSSQSWVWNFTEDNHFGCGPVGDPLGWWQCKANEKEGFLYDDIMTFDSEGNYTFNPGDGFAYANTGSEYMSEYNDGADYLFPAEEKTTKYSFENEWNSAGIEEIYLVLGSGSIMSYVPHKSAVENPRFQVMETKASAMKKKLQFMSTVYTPNNKDGISWYYEFVPEGSVVGDADPLYGYDSKTWVLDNDTQGYMGCGESLINPTGWWSAVPHDKDGWGVKDDELTFFKGGKYVFNPGEDGVVYVNWESGYHPELYVGDKADYDAPCDVQESTYTLASDTDGEYIELPAGVFFSYVPNKAVLSEPTHLYIKELTDEQMTLIAKFEGISWQLIFRPKDGQGGDDTPDADNTDYDVNGDTNLWKSATITPEMWYSPSDWSGGLEPDFSITEGNGFQVTIPEGVGGSEWMAQSKLKSGIATSSEKEYDFAVTLTADQDMTVTIKLTNDPEEENDVHAFFYDGSVQLEAGESFTYRKHNIKQSVSGNNLMLIFDFGRSPIGSSIKCTDILFQEHKEKGEMSYDVDGERNLWKSASITPELWYSPSDWSGGLNPEYSLLDNNGISVVVPEGVGGSEWMGQTKLISNIATSPDKVYDFCATLLADDDMTITIKLTSNPEGEGDLHAFFYNGSVVLEADTPFTFKMPEIKQKEGSDNLMLIFDLGRSPIGSSFQATGICFQEHK
ncbi:MAG: hypothetical protein IJL91_13115 [Bacteroidales bacterium]|nr:hypothetical protein [Bacteroidales bacterium]